jgi:tRNA(Ile)-lysidine synthase
LISKSAKRRAKKKAKKIKEVELAQEKNNIEQVEQVIDNPQTIIQPSQQVNPLQQNKKNKKQNKNVDRLEPLAILEKRTEIYSETEDKKEFVTYNKKQHKPIPWVDLSLLEKQQQEQQQTTNILTKDQQQINPDMLLSAAEQKNPFFQNFYRDIEKYVITEMLVANGSNVVIGVSGGVDSIVLLDVFANLANTYNFKISVAHYNHNLRGEASNRDENFVKKIAQKYNIPFYTSSGKVRQYAEKNGMSIEESARTLRYVFFERVTRTINADFIATAHTKDDSVETFLLNLFRGTGLTGLSGIPAKRQFVKDVILIRPFLKLNKQNIIEYADNRNLKWSEDETNKESKYMRNKIRLNLIPKLKNDYTPAIIDVINRAAKLIQGADRIIHNYVKTNVSKLLFDISNDSVSIRLPLLKTFDEFIRGEMIQYTLMKYFRTDAINMRVIDRILKLESSDVGAFCDINKVIYAVKDRQAIVIAK